VEAKRMSGGYEVWKWKNCVEILEAQEGEGVSLTLAYRLSQVIAGWVRLKEERPATDAGPENSADSPEPLEETT
jgi:hypothetical protein